MPLAALEGLALALTAAVHLAWPDGVVRLWFIVPVVLGWGGWVAHRARTEPALLDAWGFRREGFGPSLLAVLAGLAVAAPALLAIGRLTGGLPLGPTTVASMVGYPVWGLAQQFLVLALVTGPLSRLPIPHARAFGVAVGALGFGLVHVTEPVLVPATFLLGLATGAIWLRWRNLWPLALAHGWLGALAYPLLVHRDPIAEFLAGLAT